LESLVATNFITKQAAAERASCSVKTIQRLIAAGTLPAYKVGARGVRIDVDELDAALRQHPHSCNAAGSRLAEHVAAVVAQAPALTPAQRDRIAALLRGGAA